MQFMNAQAHVHTDTNELPPSCACYFLSIVRVADVELMGDAEVTPFGVAMQEIGNVDPLQK